MTEQKTGPTFDVCLDTKRETCGGKEVEDEADDVANRHCHRRPEVYFSLRHIIADELYKPKVDAILQESRSDTHNTKPYHFAQLLAFIFT